MAVTPSCVAFLIVVACLAPSPGWGRGQRLWGRTECQISRYSRLPPSAIQPFVKLHRNLGSSLASGHRRVLVSSVQLRRLEVPERLLLVEAEINLIVRMIRELEEWDKPRTRDLTRDVLQILHQMRRNLSRCIPDTLRDETKYSKQLSKFLRNLDRAGKSVNAKSAAGKVASDLFLLLNEHLTCVSKGEDC